MKQVICCWLSFFFVGCLAAQPVINLFSPLKGPVGTLVTITGSGFASLPADNIVYFGGVRATVISATPTQLTMLAPAGATFRPVTVTANGLTAYSRQPFVVTFAGGGLPFSAANFPVRDDYASGNGAQKIIAADCNVDGKPDVITMHAPFSLDAYISVYENISTTGNPLLGNALGFSLLAEADAVASADFDGDGLVDLVSPAKHHDSISVLQNSSAGGIISFNSHVDFGVPNSSWEGICVVAGDFDLDGRPDIVVSYPGTDSVSIFRNTTVGSILSFHFISKAGIVSGSENMAVADIDDDGNPDLLVSNFISGYVSILRNTSTAGTISFAEKIDIASGVNGNGVAVGDFDEDGKLDMVTSEYVFGFNGSQGNDRVNVFRNTSTPGNISFATKIAYPVGLNPFNPALGDIDGDGKIDIAVTTSGSGILAYNKLTLLRNTSTMGNISFEPGYEYATLANPWSCEISDLDLDGRPEILVTNFNSPFISVFRNSTGTLPLKLLSFNAARRGVHNQLRWTTANELNVDRFIIEYSFDGRMFDDAGTVKAANNHFENSYSFVHGLSRTGTIYYRLKMLDKDGTFTYSPVKSIKSTSSMVTLWPNPAGKILNVQGDALQQVIIIDNLGRVLLDKRIANAVNTQLDISTLPKGYCWVKISSGLQIIIEKLLIE